MVYTLGEAANATGKSKATISKAIKSGRISASKGENGAYQIDPSELHRVYPVNSLPKHQSEQKETLVNTEVNNSISSQIKELELKLEATQQRLSDKEEQLADLKEDRDKWRQQATALLEDQRPKRRWLWNR